jgi:hypothetical protein
MGLGDFQTVMADGVTVRRALSAARQKHCRTERRWYLMAEQKTFCEGQGTHESSIDIRVDCEIYILLLLPDHTEH